MIGTSRPNPASILDRDDTWRDRAACRDEDSELFFPIGDTGPALLQAEEAKAICARCPVMDACLQAALAEEGGRARDGRHGIRGGLDHAQRHALYQREARARRRGAA